MLFAYKYVSHDMDKMQVFIDFIFYEVWCKAPDEEYGIHLYEPEETLYKIMNELFRLDLAEKLKKGAGKYFYESINEIFNEFKTLTKGDIDEYKRHFDDNNRIEELCSGETHVTPVTYELLNTVNMNLNKKIEVFFKNLYSSGFYNLKIVEDNIGVTLGEYYKFFVNKNDEGLCPFCGLMPIDGEYDPTREAFDHYLPKSKYPFNSVNLKNLAPSCNKCNSGNKRDKDPLHDDKGVRRKAFYPFSSASSDINLSISIKDKFWDDLRPVNISVDFSSDIHNEEILTWKELFGIEQRYSAKCCNRNGGIGWLGRVLDEHQNYKLSPQDMLEAEIQTSSASPWLEANFLKKAFLEGCNRQGLFQDYEKLGSDTNVLFYLKKQLSAFKRLIRGMIVRILE